uniref:Uncharacterized protein n=1 Tax=Pseudo-nitzschia australis TaxID=44445 RepID=A0A7S4AXF9_9STRA|mmetsp:Transcript_17196/g.37621  ORF Transcript_17196/g.37621 Transcript_17196/m.37621 type:complete len:111 (-) Transcript_17196:197-529(-)
MRYTLSNKESNRINHCFGSCSNLQFRPFRQPFLDKKNLHFLLLPSILSNAFVIGDGLRRVLPKLYTDEVEDGVTCEILSSTSILSNDDDDDSSHIDKIISMDTFLMGNVE